VSTLGVLAAASAGGLIGGVVATALPRLVPRWRWRKGAGVRPPAEDGSIGTVYRKINDVMEALERVQGDLNTLTERVSRLTPPPSSVERPAGTGTQPGWPSGRTPSTLRQPPETRTTYDYGASAGPRYDPPRPPDRDFGGSPGGFGGSPGDFGGSRGGDIVQDDAYGNLGADVGLPAGPPANALNVEARDDRIVATASFPPEAWLEIGPGPAEGRVSLNPAVALNEYALRRLSTFFELQGARAGTTYHTVTPASVRWDDGQRVGTLLSRGVARPR
jgi:hypothetical protein